MEIFNNDLYKLAQILIQTNSPVFRNMLVHIIVLYSRIDENILILLEAFIRACALFSNTNYQVFCSSYKLFFTIIHK